MHVTSEEFLQLHHSIATVEQECARLQEQVRRLQQENEHYKALMLMSKLKEQYNAAAQEPVVLLSLSNVRKVLGQQMSPDDVSRILFAMIRMLPGGASAEAVKQLVDAAPDGVLPHETVQVNIGTAEDVVTNGGVKNVNVNTQTRQEGGTEK